MGGLVLGIARAVPKRSEATGTVEDIAGPGNGGEIGGKGGVGGGTGEGGFEVFHKVASCPLWCFLLNNVCIMSAYLAWRPSWCVNLTYLAR